MKDDFDIVLRTYNTKPSNIVDSSEEYYKALVNDAPAYIQDLVGDNYSVKGSCGQGNKALNPWICVFDSTMTANATHGVYICYLFRSDMSGFYVTLSQGITAFADRFGTDRYNAARKVALYFQRRISDNYFSREQIELRSPKGSLGYGYEMTTILSKFYAPESFSDDELCDDLKRLLVIYQQLLASMGGASYDSVIGNVYDNQKDEFQSSGAAIRSIENTINEPEDEEGEKELTLVDTIEPKKKTYRNIATRAPRKIDYLKKAESDGKVGLKGEKLVLDYERKRMRDAGREDLVDKIKWVAEDDDTLGYDISSFDFRSDGSEYEICIEVKTTRSELNNAFFITDNELKAIRSNPEIFRIYRVSVKKGEPTLYIYDGSDFEDRFGLSPYNYLAALKEHDD